MKQVSMSVERTARWCVALSALALGAGCASSDLPGEVPEAPVRQGQDRPGDPTTEDTDLPYEDAGNPNNGGGGGDEDAGNPNNGGGDDDAGGGGCGTLVCAFGETRCAGEAVETCEEGPDGCPRWGAPSTCPGTEVCVGGFCEEVNGCVDNDRDGYGINCINGPDCDDDDDERNSGRVEVCDGKDNNCDGATDEGLPGVGDACTSGMGVCENPGATVCTPTGQIVCDATPGTPSAETCDGLDNDCNGIPDDGIMCMGPACGEDPQEPNNALSAGFLTAPETPLIGLTCQTDLEYYTLDTVAGTTYRLNLAFPHDLSDQDLVLYEDGIEVQRADSFSDHEQLVFTPRLGSVYTAQVTNPSGSETYHRLALTSSWDCTSEDEFSPNQNPNDAAFLLQGWLTPAHLCSGSEDWYRLGEVNAGDVVRADIFFSSFLCLGSDLDIELYTNYDNDAQLELATRSTGACADDDAEFTATGTTQVYMRVYPFSGGGTNYDVGWLVR